MFIHLPVDGHFQFEAIVNKASMNICVQLFVQMYVFISPDVELLVYMESMCLN